MPGEGEGKRATATRAEMPAEDAFDPHRERPTSELTGPQNTGAHSYPAARQGSASNTGGSALQEPRRIYCPAGGQSLRRNTMKVLGEELGAKLKSELKAEREPKYRSVWNSSNTTEDALRFIPGHSISVQL